MGRDKARLPWISGQPLLRWMIDELREAGWQPIVVLGPSNFGQWARELPDGIIVLNPCPETGKTTSIAAGARRVPDDARAILLTAVDQPRPREIHAALREAAAAQPGGIFVPDYRGRRGHPVVVPGAFRERLLGLDEASDGLRGLLDAHAAEMVRLKISESAWMDWDLNTPADYEAAVEWLKTTRSPET